MKILKEILRFFQNVFKILSSSGENMGKYKENFKDMQLCGVRGAEPSEASELF